MGKPSEEHSDASDEPLTPSFEEQLAEAQLDAQNPQSDIEDDSEDEGVSLEQLSQSYAEVLGTDNAEVSPSEVNDSDSSVDEDETDAAEDADGPVRPLSIVESILYVGRPDNKPITASEIARLMRGVSEKEVRELIDELNSQYADKDRAIRVVEHAAGFQIEIVEDLNFIRERFYGRVREVALNQAAVDCLALVAYQPGITRTKLEEQRGQPSGGVLNQLVRRQLIEMHREDEGGKMTPHYYPTDKLVELAGLSTLEDLPQVEEFGLD